MAQMEDIRTLYIVKKLAKYVKDSTSMNNLQVYSAQVIQAMISYNATLGNSAIKDADVEVIRVAQAQSENHVRNVLDGVKPLRDN